MSPKAGSIVLMEDGDLGDLVQNLADQAAFATVDGAATFVRGMLKAVVSAYPPVRSVAESAKLADVIRTEWLGMWRARPNDGLAASHAAIATCCDYLWDLVLLTGRDDPHLLESDVFVALSVLANSKIKVYGRVAAFQGARCDAAVLEAQHDGIEEALAGTMEAWTRRTLLRSTGRLNEEARRFMMDPTLHCRGGAPPLDLSASACFDLGPLVSNALANKRMTLAGALALKAAAGGAAATVDVVLYTPSTKPPFPVRPRFRREETGTQVVDEVGTRVVEDKMRVSACLRRRCKN